MADRTLRLAHRGDWRNAPENSIAAMVAAIAAPDCDGLEFDVRLSADRVPVVIHDATLARVQGRPDRVDALTAAELGALGVPALADLLLVAPRSAFLDIELKEEPGPDIVGIIAAARGPELGNAVVSSFHREPLVRIARLAPAWSRWLNADEVRPKTIALALELGCRGVAADWRTIDAGAVERARAAGLVVVAYTVGRRPTFDRLARLGVVAVCVEGAALDA